MISKFYVRGIRKFDEEKVIDCTFSLFGNDENNIAWRGAKSLGEGEVEAELMCSMPFSTQGVGVKHLYGRTIIVELPWLASEEDVRLCYCFLNAIKMTYRAARITDEKGDGLSLTDVDMERQWQLRCENMFEILLKNEVTVVAGVNRDFHIDPNHYRIADNINNVVDQAFSDFLAIQWNALEAVKVEEEKRHVCEPDELSSVRVIDNSKTVFIGACQYVGMMKENTCKMVAFDDFCRLMDGEKEFCRMDVAQAILYPIDEERWLRLYAAAEGIIRDCFRKTFIMRWNTDISNYKLPEFEDAMYEFEDERFYYDWSIWDHQKVHVGDRFYMIRTGKGNHGIVMRGTITGVPYPDEDWSGHGRRVYYVRMKLTHMIHPDLSPYMLSTGELAKYLPNFNWENGHSGELLDDGTAQLLEEIWQHHNNHVHQLIDKEYHDTVDFESDDEDEDEKGKYSTEYYKERC